jgi:hypothetical protein
VATEQTTEQPDEESTDNKIEDNNDTTTENQ